MSPSWNVSCSPEDAMKDAGKSADIYLRQAIKSIDDRLGTGFARANPEVLAAMIRAQATEFATAAALVIAQNK